MASFVEVLCSVVAFIQRDGCGALSAVAQIVKEQVVLTCAN
ncbi:hypothetical protein ACWO25_004559 [Vibrio parahaemolyticus]